MDNGHPYSPPTKMPGFLVNPDDSPTYLTRVIKSVRRRTKTSGDRAELLLPRIVHYGGHQPPTPPSPELVPTAKTKTWSQADDETLIKSRAQGTNWDQIASKHFPRKSANACRRRHEQVMEKQNAKHWDGVRLEVLAEAYMEVRSEMWSILGAKLNAKWELAEQKCMEQGLPALHQLDRTYRERLRAQDAYDTSEDVGDTVLNFPALAESPLGDSCEYLALTPPPINDMYDDNFRESNDLRHPSAHADYNPSQIPGTGGFTREDTDKRGDEQSHAEEQDPPSIGPTSPIYHPSSPFISSTDTRDSLTPSEDSHGSLESDMTGIEVRKELLLDRLMLRFYDIFDNQGWSYRHCPSSSASSKGSPSKGTASRTTNRTTTAKHCRSSEQDDDDYGRDDLPKKRPRETCNFGTSAQEHDKRSFACTFYKHDPETYRTARSCSGPTGWETIARLKEHLYRRHTLSPQCVRCCKIFDGEDKLTEHQRTPEGCSIRIQEPLEGLSKRQIEQLKRRSRMFQAGSEEEKWRIIYTICFPDATPGTIPTPYYECSIADAKVRDLPPNDPTLAQYEAYMNRELPRKVRKELEIAIEKLFGPLEETLKNQLEGLVRNCQERLSKDYVSSKESVHDRGQDAMSGVAGPSCTDTTSRLSAIATLGVLAPYTVPMESSFDLWQGMNTASNLQNCAYSDSAYFSQANYPLPSDPWWPSTIDPAQLLAESDPPEMGLTSSLGSHCSITDDTSSSSYKGKGKARADDDKSG